MVSLVETLVSRDSAESPKRRVSVACLILDGSKMTRGRKAEIEAWVEYLEIFLPWLALFDDRIPGEISRTLGKNPQYRTPGCRRVRV